MTEIIRSDTIFHKNLMIYDAPLQDNLGIRNPGKYTTPPRIAAEGDGYSLLKCDGVHTYMNSGIMFEDLEIAPDKDFTMVFQFKVENLFIKHQDSPQTSNKFPVICKYCGGGPDTEDEDFICYIKSDGLYFQYTACIRGPYAVEPGWNTMVIAQTIMKGHESNPWIVVFLNGVSILHGGYPVRYVNGASTSWYSYVYKPGCTCFGTAGYTDSTRGMQLANIALRNLRVFSYGCSQNVPEGTNFKVYFSTEKVSAPLGFSNMVNSKVKQSILQHENNKRIVRYKVV